MSVFLIVVVGIGWVFSQVYGDSSFVVVAVAFSLFMNFFSYWFSDKIVLAMSGARPIKKEEDLELYRIVENLCIAAGLKAPKIYMINDPSPNAFATGRNQEHAAVAVTSGLRQMLNKNELEGVVAHELSHIGNKDILISTIIVILVGFVALLSDFFLRARFFRSRRDNREGGGQAQTIMMLVGIILAILTPIVAKLIQLAISRKREFLADASGALLTRYPEGLARALEKISADPTPMQTANNATSHLWIDNPFKGKNRASWFGKLFTTHPPVEERIKALRDMSI
ncbi:zinc metalloprotease HtpX [Candidatus Jorgensenbacteria bacterium RIFCSPLOWO2_12_FULL_42_11]|uniref:Protease HtpX homolog n=1 Tax=Candidatus Jorgensenbacteria bacterium RIFCSPLOWO2_12_FULL_42_11 TaxID=1798473 RepID=A0A1F6C0X1_9BACT|nr:MAG: zinc metalloprotease HtpX [Candidatus Jorgensenbacteria bacterium RIFCSPLOWO2_12_FULL_42_11]